MPSLQEKFQISPPLPKRDEADDKWVTAESQRHPREEGWTSHKSSDVDMRRFNEMPEDMEICQISGNKMPLRLSGESDVSGDVNSAALRDGFKKIEMDSIDDQYTGEHMDLFYGDAGGFVERNNYLDRE